MELARAAAAADRPAELQVNMPKVGSISDSSLTYTEQVAIAGGSLFDIRDITFGLCKHSKENVYLERFLETLQYLVFELKCANITLTLAANENFRGI